MTNTLNSFRNWAVGFIDWLDASDSNYGRGGGVGRGCGVGRSLGVGDAAVGEGVGDPGGSLGVGFE